MIGENDFRDKAAQAIEDLEKRLFTVADIEGFEVESGGGMLTLIFEEPSPAKFIISPNTSARQIWVSALATSHKFDWDDGAGSFVLDKTREPFAEVIAKLLEQQLGKRIVL